MYNAEKHSTVLENATGFALQSHNKMAAMGYVYTLRKPTLLSTKCCTSHNATSTDFLEVQIPLRVFVYD